LLRNFLNGLIIHLRGPMESPQTTNQQAPPKLIRRKAN
jgi:hypothetical protein